MRVKYISKEKVKTIYDNKRVSYERHFSIFLKDIKVVKIPGGTIFSSVFSDLAGNTLLLFSYTPFK